MRGATCPIASICESKYISIHAPHARSDATADLTAISGINISIHAPHARSDAGKMKQDVSSNISIHAPHARSDFMLQEIEAEHTEFQSTLLLRGATSLILHKDTVTLISIHAPHARSDDKTHKMIHDAYRFQSTLLMRGATVSILGIDLPDFIIYFSRTYPFSPKMPTSRHLSCKLHFLCDGTSHFGDL